MTTDMTFPELELGRRTAMLDWTIQHHSLSREHGIATAEDLYEFMLLDPLINEQVETSDVAMASASLRQYVHAIFGGMEPGYAGVYRKDVNKEWRDRRSEYALWAGYQMLANYPENYIQPSLRSSQTMIFRQFVNETSQGAMTEHGAKQSVMNYLHRFEETANLKIVSGYGTALDLRNADYYFLGVSAEGKYFWRVLHVEVDSNSDIIPATAWTEWKSVDVPLTGGVLLGIRPVWFNGRLYVGWAEHRRLDDYADEEGKAIRTDQITVCLSHLTLQGQWSVPIRQSWAWGVTKDSPWRDPAKITFALFANNDAVGDRTLLIGLHPQDKDEASVASLFNEYLDDLTANASSHWAKEHAHKLLNGYGARESKLQIAVPMTSEFSWRSVVTLDEKAGSVLAGATLELSWSGKLRVHCKWWGAFVNLFSHELWIKVSIVGPDGKDLATIKDYLGSDWIHRGEWEGYVDGELKKGATYTIKVVARRLAESAQFERTVTIDAAPKSLSVPEIMYEADGGQFLDIKSLKLDRQSHIRLNTVFGCRLVDIASRSIDELMDWATQCSRESAAPEGAVGVADTLDFHGANGRCFWEIFFHIPHHIAWQLSRNGDYARAEDWLHYVFNPLAKVSVDTTNPHAYWASRPLLEESMASYEIEGPVDPDAICYSKPIHYRKAIFIAYVRNLMAWGDHLYRRLTRDSLNEAKLLYVRALSLMGPMPDNRMIGRWEPTTLAEAARWDDAIFAEFENDESLVSVLDDGGRSIHAPWIDLLDATRFRMPLNSELLSIWDDIALRLDSLRSNLTIDGKPLMIPLYDAPANPRDLLMAQSEAGGSGQRTAGGLAVIPPYRFRAMLPRAQAAVDTLCRFGDQVLGLRERKDRAHLEELLQLQIQEMSSFSEGIQEAAVEQAEENVKALEKSKAISEVRQTYLETLISTNKSQNEKEALDTYMAAGVFRGLADGWLTAGGIVTAAAFLAGTSFGLLAPGAAMSASGGIALMTADATTAAADGLMRTDGFERRLAEWKNQKDVVDKEIDAIDQQIEVLKKAKDLTRKQLGMAKRARAHANDHYTFLKSRSTNEGLYQWLLGQVSAYYFQAYDAVVALCLATEAAWNYEMGDYATRFIQPNVWFDAHHGLLAGEALKLQLIKMETAHVKRNERRLEITRTVSLKALFDQAKEDGRDSRDGAAALRELVDKGTLAFDLPCSLFDHDHPGHYLRQIASVSVSLPLVVGAYENIKAVLTQTGSFTLLKADENAVGYFYGENDASVEHIVFNPRAMQSIALSHGVDDAGMHQLLFLDDRYLPFEGTGAVSRWELTFPRHDRSPQKAMLDTLTDVILNVQYTAMDGGRLFAGKVEKLLDSKLAGTPEE